MELVDARARAPGGRERHRRRIRRGRRPAARLRQHVGPDVPGPRDRQRHVGPRLLARRRRADGQLRHERAGRDHRTSWGRTRRSIASKRACPDGSSSPSGRATTPWDAWASSSSDPTARPSWPAARPRVKTVGDAGDHDPGQRGQVSSWSSDGGDPTISGSFIELHQPRPVPVGSTRSLFIAERGCPGLARPSPT